MDHGCLHCLLWKFSLCPSECKYLEHWETSCNNCLYYVTFTLPDMGCENLNCYKNAQLSNFSVVKRRIQESGRKILCLSLVIQPPRKQCPVETIPLAEFSLWEKSSMQISLYFLVLFTGPHYVSTKNVFLRYLFFIK